MGNSWRKGAFCSICIFHDQKMHIYLIEYCKILILLWQKCYAIGQACIVVDGQIF